jgi:hypothetical protein
MKRKKRIATKSAFRKHRAPRRSVAFQRNKEFYFSRKFKCFVAQGKSMRGVCPFITKHFQPTNPSPFPLSFRSGSQGRKMKSHGRGRVGFTGDSKNYGMFFGLRIHNEIKRYCSSAQRRITKRMHKTTKAVIEKLRSLGLLIVDSEVPVWWYDAKLATRIDIRCKDQKGKYVLIELKTGGTHDFFGGSQLLRPPFYGFTHSLCNLAYLQLLATVILFRKTHPAARVSGALVVYAAHGEVHCLNIPKQMLTSIHLLENAMIQTI